MMNENVITNTRSTTWDALIVVVRAIRPGWDEPGCKAAIRKTITARPSEPLDQVAQAFIRLAATRKVQTPMVLPLYGDHWPRGDEAAAPTRESPGRAAAPACRHDTPHGTWDGDGKNGPNWTLCARCRHERSPNQGEPA